MDIKAFAKVFVTHGRTFNVPAGPPFSPGALPVWLTGFGWFPQSEVQRTSLFFVHGDSGTRLHIIGVAVGQFSIFTER